MSSIFRPQKTSETVRHIGIRNLQSRPKTNVNEQESTLSTDEILHERDQLINQAQQTIEEERKSVDEMRQTAAADIEAMQKAWKEEKEVLQQQAYDEGFELGYKEGHDKVTSDMMSSLEEANKVVKQAQDNARKYLDSQEQVILELGIRVAEEIIGDTLEAKPSSFLSVVQRALKEAKEMKEIKLYVSLHYYELVSNHQEELAAIFPPDVPFLVFANEDFETNECYIETNHGRIVVTIDEQLTEVREILIQIMESGD